ncbi:hypothetical protein Tco_1030548 [Tanacetum coccineum]|uniref:Uncharacterized protein n=1 Tax=Tanacetum coccineum TaxID=301880 RepID=A0ABQ5G8D9_9ASTR
MYKQRVSHDGKKKRDSFYQHQEARKQEKNQMGLLTMDDGIVILGSKHIEDEETIRHLMAIAQYVIQEAQLLAFNSYEEEMNFFCFNSTEVESVGKPLYMQVLFGLPLNILFDPWKSEDFKGNWGSAVKTSAGYNWRLTRPNSNCNGRPTFIRTMITKGSSTQEHGRCGLYVIVDCSGLMTYELVTPLDCNASGEDNKKEKVQKHLLVLVWTLKKLSLPLKKLILVAEESQYLLQTEVEEKEWGTPMKEEEETQASSKTYKTQIASRRRRDLLKLSIR